MDRGKDGCVDRSIIDGKIERLKDQKRYRNILRQTDS